MTDAGQPASRVELPELRTATSSTFDLGDGRLLTEFAADPIFFQPDGSTEFVPIELDFRADPATKRAAVQAAPVGVSVGKAADGIVGLEWDDHRIAFRPIPAAALDGLRGAVPSAAELDEWAPLPADPPVVVGRAADVGGILPGVGLRVVAQAHGAKSFLVLDRPIAASAFTFLVSAAGLTLRTTDRGALEFVDDATGKALAEMPAPYAVDSTPDEFTGSGETTTAVHYELGALGAAQSVTIRVDPEWLAKAVYPVYIDPSTVIYNDGSSTYGDTHVNEGNPNFNYANYLRPDAPNYYEMWLGESPSNSAYWNEAYVKFDMTQIAGQVVDSASMEVRPYHQYYDAPTATNTFLRRVTAAWTESITWATKPAYTNTGVTYEGCVEGLQCAFDVTAWTRGWVDGSSANYGVHLSEIGTDNVRRGPTYWKRLLSAEHGTSIVPKIYVTYHAPTTPVYPVSGPTSSRTLSWTNDALWGQTKFHVDVATDAAFGTIVATSGDVTSAATSWAVAPATTLTEGTTYHWRVRSQRSTTTWGAWAIGSFVPNLSLLGSQQHHRSDSWDLGGGDSLAVDSSSLNAIVSHPIVSLPIRGGGFDLGLTYNAQDPGTVGVGRGWQLNAFRRLTVNPGNGWVTLTDDSGARHTFSTPTGSGTLTYTRPATIYANLSRDTNATPDRFTLTYRDKTIDVFDELATNTGFLVAQKDRFQNTVAFGYSGTSLVTIDDPSGRRIDLVWTSGKLTQIKDWAWVSGGIVQATATGVQRTHRFFYDGFNRLVGWADPLETSANCPATPTTNTASHLTCLGYDSNGYLATITKAQSIATLSGGVIGTAAPRSITTQIDNAGTSEVRDIRDAEQYDGLDPANTFRRTAGLVEVVRQGTPASTTRYAVPGAAEPYGRITSVKRKIGASWIEQLTGYNATYPTEPASVTDNNGALLSTPARTASYTYVASSMGLVARLTEPLTASTNRTTDYLYNANNDVTQRIVALDGSATVRTISRSCYSATTCGTADNDSRLFRTIDNYVDGIAGNGAANVEDVTTSFLYDTYGQQIRSTRSNYNAAGTLLDSAASGSTYDDKGNLTSSIANYANGTVTNPGDDIDPNTTTNARTDLTTAYTHDTAGSQVSSADPRRAIETAKGTALGADGFIARSTFDPLGQRLTEKTPTTPTLTITCAAPSPNCRSSSTTYDELGAILRATDFGNLVTASAYDRAGNAIKTFEDPPDIGAVKPADTTSETTYDASGRALTTKDQVQFDDTTRGFSQFVYDELGRQIASAEAVGTTSASETDTSWDALDRAKATTIGVASPTSQTTTTTYDLAGRAITVDDEFACTATAYDHRDFATQTVEGLPTGTCSGTSLRTITHTPDGLARLTKSEVTAGAGLGDIPAQRTFDGAGRVLTSSSTVAATGTTTTVTSTYSPLDAVIVETRSDGSRTRTIYDPVGNATDRCYWAVAPTPDEACQPVGGSFTVPPTRHSSATFDARNNRVTLVDAATKATTIYDPDHNYLTKAIYVPTKMTGTAVDVELQSSFSYDERHRLAGISHQTCTRTSPASSTDHSCTATTASGSVSYGYDQNDNRTFVNENNGATSAVRYYCHDPLDRLQYRNTGSACSAGAKDEEYVYDAAGNRTKTIIGATSPVTTTFGYDPQGQLCKVSAATPTDCTSANVTYDSAGRTTAAAGWWFTYDADGRLIKACESATCATTADKLEMVYDAEGRRTKLISDPAGASLASTREFRYQGDAIVEERVGGVVSRSYLVDESGSVVHMVIPAGQPEPAGTYLVTWNGHGDVLALSRIKPDGSLELANTFTYGSWGQPTVKFDHPNSANANLQYGDLGFRFLYVGEFDVQWDRELGLDLYYMHARHYSPTTGRFIQPDPDRSEANLYAYAQNNPITEIDPDGTCFILCVVVVGVLLFGGLGAATQTALYASSTPRDNWRADDAAGAAAGGFLDGATLAIPAPGGRLAAKIVAKAITKLLAKVPKAARAMGKQVKQLINHNDYLRIGKGPVQNKVIRPRQWAPGSGPKDTRYTTRVSIGNKTSAIRGHIHKWNLLEGPFGKYGWFQRFPFPRLSNVPILRRFFRD